MVYRNSNILRILILGIAVIPLLAISCNPASVLENQQPVEVVSAVGPLEPINPGGPVVEITLSNISDDPVISLTANLEQDNPFEYTFDFDGC